MIWHIELDKCHKCNKGSFLSLQLFQHGFTEVHQPFKRISKNNKTF